MKAVGFEMDARNSQDLSGIKQSYGINPRYQSCHTAVSKQGYFFEGHIPARLVSRFLASPPDDAIGLSAPGMPVGSPGMEVGDKFRPYKVLLLLKGGTSKVFSEVTQLEELS